GRQGGSALQGAPLQVSWATTPLHRFRFRECIHDTCLASHTMSEREYQRTPHTRTTTLPIEHRFPGDRRRAYSLSTSRFSCGDKSFEEFDGARSICGVTIRTNLIAELLGDGSAADSDFHIETISVDSLDDCLHVNHCCCQQCAHADDLGIVIRRGTNEFICTSVCAKIHYRETRSLGHHTDEILADIMQITLHSPHNDGALAAGVF